MFLKQGNGYNIWLWINFSHEYGGNKHDLLIATILCNLKSENKKENKQKTHFFQSNFLLQKKNNFASVFSAKKQKTKIS